MTKLSETAATLRQLRSWLNQPTAAVIAQDCPMEMFIDACSAAAAEHGPSGPDNPVPGELIIKHLVRLSAERWGEDGYLFTASEGSMVTAQIAFLYSFGNASDATLFLLKHGGDVIE